MYDWKKTPISLAIKSKLRADLAEAGFKTVGDLVDADPADIVKKVKGVGLVRAERLRDAALASVLSEVTVEPVEPKQKSAGNTLFVILAIFAVVGIAILVNLAIDFAA